MWYLDTYVTSKDTYSQNFYKNKQTDKQKNKKTQKNIHSIPGAFL